VRCLFALLFAGALWAQPDPRQLVRQSIENGERSWRASFDYFAVKHDVERQFDSQGHVRSADADVYYEIPVGYHDSFEEHVRHDNEPLPPDQRRKIERELARRKAESPAQKQRDLQKRESERSYMKEVPDAFDFKITGTENLPTGPAWVLEATPRPGYQPKSRYSRMFPYMRGRLWIDKKDIQWVKADAVSTSTVSFGFFIARLAKGSHIVLEQEHLPDGSWVAGRIMAKASARTFLIFNHNFDEDITWSDYHKGPSSPLSAAR